MITTVKAKFTFLYLPANEHCIVPGEIFEEAAEWLCDRLNNFYGWGVNDDIEIIEIYTKNKRKLVEFIATFSTEDFDGVMAYADEVISFKEEY